MIRGVLIAIAASGHLLVLSVDARAELSPREVFRGLLAQQFEASDAVTHEELRLDEAARARVERRLGYRLDRDRYTFYVARTGGRVDGYAYLGLERSLHATFLFAMFFDTQGRVSRAEVVEYREDRGGEIRSRRFLEQFEGRHTGSGFRPGRDVDMVTGASVSSVAMIRGAELAAVLVEELRRSE